MAPLTINETSSSITDDDLASYEAMIDAADFGILRTNLRNPRYIEELQSGYTGGGPVIADVHGPQERPKLLAAAPAALKATIAEVRRLRAIIDNLPPNEEGTPMVSGYHEIRKRENALHLPLNELREARSLIAKATKIIIENSCREDETRNEIELGGVIARLSIVRTLLDDILPPRA